MQLFALNDDNESILAQEALRHKNYLCPECLYPVRARGGPHKRHHFYHPKGNISCSQHKKSLLHISLQVYLFNALPGAQLERPFPQIGRIADVYWEAKHMVFEVQCSPMTLQEATQRCNDYQKLGIKLVWILHQKRFNKKNLSPAEQFLRVHTNCYYAGNQIIYDQFEICKKSRRIFRGAPLKIDLRYPKELVLPKREPPEILRKRFFKWSCYFPGDLNSHFINGQDFSTIFAIEKKFINAKKDSLFTRLKRFYQIIFHYLLEKASQ